MKKNHAVFVACQLNAAVVSALRSTLCTRRGLTSLELLRQTRQQRSLTNRTRLSLRKAMEKQEYVSDVNKIETMMDPWDGATGVMEVLSEVMEVLSEARDILS